MATLSGGLRPIATGAAGASGVRFAHRTSGHAPEPTLAAAVDAAMFG